MALLHRSSIALGVVVAIGIGAPAAAQTQAVTDPDSSLTVMVPASWMASDLGNTDASVQMTDSAGEVGMMIIVEPKADFFGWNMTRFMYATMGQGVAALDLPEVSDVVRDPIDGADAATVQINGAIGGQQYSYLRSAIDAPEHYIQVILFTSRSAWPTHRESLEAVIASVDLLGR